MTTSSITRSSTSKRVEDKTPQEQSYEDVRRLIAKVSSSFRRRFGGDYQEIISEANVAFLEAYRTYDCDRGSFSKRVSYVVYMQLVENACKRMNHAKKYPEVLITPDVPEKHHHGGLGSILSEVSEDAAIVIRLVLDPPGELYCRMPPPRSSSFRAEEVRDAVADFLLDVGWATRRVIDAFDEIREVLGYGI